MECPGELVRILILETGCSKKTKGFTLIEVLVVLVIIGITSSLLFLNIGLADTVSKNKLSLNTLFNYLSEESIIPQQSKSYGMSLKELFSLTLMNMFKND